MKILLPLAFLLFGVGSCLHIESDLPELIGNLEFERQMSAWATEMTLDGTPVDYIGVFREDIAFESGNGTSVMEMMGDYHAQHHMTPKIPPYFTNVARDEPGGFKCSKPLCLTKRDGNNNLKLKRSVKRRALDEKGCDILSHFIAPGSGAIFALIGGLLCVNPAGAVPCAILFGIVGAVAGDAIKEHILPKFCGAESARNNQDCKRLGFFANCKDKKGHESDFIRSYHPKKYGCKQVRKQFEGENNIKCKKVQN